MVRGQGLEPLLAGLPEMYGPMIMALESLGVAITADSVKTKLLQDVRNSESALLYVNRGNKYQSQYAKQTPQKINKPREGPRCFVCNKYGHISKYCRNKKQMRTLVMSLCFLLQQTMTIDGILTMELECT